MHPVATTLREIEEQLNGYFLEREDVIRAAILAILAKEHLFILGLPGSAKTALIRAIVNAITGARYFETSLSKNKPLERVVGPLDIREFRENGNYYTKIKGFLLDVEFAMLDEVGKMSPVLGHDLLTALNERLRQEVNGGLSLHPIPLSTCFTASNEVLTSESDEAAALWDRLLVKVVVDYVQEKSNFAKLLTGGPAPTTSTVAYDDLKKVIEVDVPAVALTQEAIESLVRLRSDLAAEHIYVSDRRWKQSVKVLQAQAFLEGRDHIIDEDLAVLRWTLWDTVEQVEKVERKALTVSNPFVDDLFKQRGMLRELQKGLDDRKEASEDVRLKHGKEVNSKLKIVREELDRMLKVAAGRRIPTFKEVADFHQALLERNYQEMLGLDADEARVAASKKLGLGDGTVSE